LAIRIEDVPFGDATGQGLGIEDRWLIRFGRMGESGSESDPGQ
jgi:hypothetical protein